MDEESLAKSFLNDPSRKSSEENRVDELQREAAKIAQQFPTVTEPEERAKLEKRYAELDQEIGKAKKEVVRAAAYTNKEKEAELNGAEKYEAHLEGIEKGRKHLVEKARPGAGGNTHRRIKDELNYLLKNYAPANDWKIETLIDKWRTSGDPSYDPSIKITYRNVRRDKSKNDNHI